MYTYTGLHTMILIKSDYVISSELESVINFRVLTSNFPWISVADIW